MRSVAIIGLSSFGSFLAKELVREGVEVMALDLNDEKIEKFKNEIHKAVIADGTDKDVLDKLGLKEMDCVVVSLGQIEASVLATLNLRELKIKRIVSKALSEEHGRILQMIGASEVIFPEKDMACRVARTLTHENILDHIPLAEGYSIIEIEPPKSFLNKSLGKLDLRKRYGVQLIVVKESVPEKVVMVPTAEYIIKDSDILVMMGRDIDLKKIQDL